MGRLHRLVRLCLISLVSSMMIGEVIAAEVQSSPPAYRLHGTTDTYQVSRSVLGPLDGLFPTTADQAATAPAVALGEVEIVDREVKALLERLAVAGTNARTLHARFDVALGNNAATCDITIGDEREIYDSRDGNSRRVVVNGPDNGDTLQLLDTTVPYPEGVPGDCITLGSLNILGFQPLLDGMAKTYMEQGKGAGGAGEVATWWETTTAVAYFATTQENLVVSASQFFEPAARRPNPRNFLSTDFRKTPLGVLPTTVVEVMIDNPSDTNAYVLVHHFEVEPLGSDGSPAEVSLGEDGAARSVVVADLRPGGPPTTRVVVQEPTTLTQIVLRAGDEAAHPTLNAASGVAAAVAPQQHRSSPLLTGLVIVGGVAVVGFAILLVQRLRLGGSSGRVR